MPESAEEGKERPGPGISERLEKALAELEATRQELVQKEKLASLGALAAGIAHEIKNPLNFINNFSAVLVEMIEEIESLLTNQAERKVSEIKPELEEALSDLKANAEKISEHGRRAESIIRNMLLHSRGRTGQREMTDLNALLEEYIGLAYHGMRAQNPSFNVMIVKSFDSEVGKVEVIPQDIARVFVNLLNNAFFSVHEKSVQVQAQQEGLSFEPTVCVSTSRNGNVVSIRIEDNGGGIPEELREKIFEPFFTTKPTGSGTGLGLALSLDIIRNGHGGTLTVDSTVGEGTAFEIRIPEKRT